jgi:hypothetical protein
MSRVIHTERCGYPEVNLSWMVGRTVRAVSFYEPTLWVFSLGVTERISVQCLWRILKDGRIVRCSGDHGQPFGLPEPVNAQRDATEWLSSSPVSAVKLIEGTADVALDIGVAFRLEIIPDSSGYESWTIRGPDQICYAAHGGGLCKWVE